MFYNGNQNIAEIIGNVKLKEKDINLSSTNLSYNLKNKIAKYHSWAYITSTKNQNELTSIKGAYNSSLKTLYFKDSVQLKHPNYTMNSDTLVYQTHKETAYFSGPSKISSKESTIYCNQGWYDTRTEKASFWNNAIIETSNETLSGDSIHYNRIKGEGKVFGNVVLIDTLKKFNIKGDYAYHNEILDSSIVIGNSLLEQFYEKDTLFIIANNLVSLIDSNNLHFLRAFDDVKFFKGDIQGVCDSISYDQSDSLMKLFNDPYLWSDKNQISGTYIELNTWGGNIKNMHIFNNGFIISQVDSLNFNQIKGKDILGYFNNNMLKKICIKGNGETLYYLSNNDSEPVVDFNKTQCSELTLLLDSNEIQILNFKNSPKASMKPINSTPSELRKLDDFYWNAHSRPTKNLFISNEELDN